MKTKFTLLIIVTIAFIISCFSFKVQAQHVNVQDSLALIDLYNSTNGAQWKKNKNWLTANPVAIWYGVKVRAGRVTEIDLVNNKLGGTIPTSIGKLTSLTYLRLSINNISGSVPSSISALVNLTTLDLSTNNLTGGIPSEIGTLYKLQRLQLETNKLSGEIPPVVGNLTELNDIELGSNLLTGNIPITIKNLVKLQFLILYDNQLTGSIPGRLGSLKKLRSINLSGNELTGNIPTPLFTLKNLKYISLYGNKLTNDKSTVYPGLQPREDVSLDVSENRLNFDILQFIDSTFPFAYTNGQAFLKIHQNGNRLSVYAGGTLSANTYFWRRAGNVVATITGDSTFNPSESGLYDVFIQNSVSGETLSSYNYKYTSTLSNSLLAGQSADKIIIYPNPVNDVLHLQVKNIADITILNASGQTFIAKKINGNTSINVSALRPGIYYLKNITTNEQQQFVISR